MFVETNLKDIHLVWRPGDSWSASLTWWTVRIFFIFFCSGRGKGESEAPGGGGG